MRPQHSPPNRITPVSPALAPVRFMSMWGIVTTLVVIGLSTLLVPLLVNSLRPKTDPEAVLQQALDSYIDTLTPEEQARLDTKTLSRDVIRAYTEAAPAQSDFIANFYVPVTTTAVTVLVAAVGIWQTIQQEQRARQQQFDADSAQAAADLQQRWVSAVEGLNANNEAARSSAITRMVPLVTSSLHTQVFYALLGPVATDLPPGSKQLLVKTFTQALRQELSLAQQTGNHLELRLDHANLQYADLSGLDLSQNCLRHHTHSEPSSITLNRAKLCHANLRNTILHRISGERLDLSYADCAKANLNQANLQQATCVGTKFHAAYLVSVNFKGANLQRAQFQGAELQSAHFEGADLRGAQFEGANVNDAFFRHAKLDDSAISSLVRATHWHETETLKHFEPDVVSQLQQLSTEIYNRSDPLTASVAVDEIPK
jgi:uncharacterized protein YjbI with pentapeptide repeats